jgi:UPF0755 protein
MTTGIRKILTAAAVVLSIGCGGEGDGEPVRVHVPPGSSFNQVVDSLDAKGVVRAAPLFRIYGRLQGSAGRVRPGTYAFRPNTGWDVVLDALVSGRVLTSRVVIPEGWDINGIAPRIAEITGDDADSIRVVLLDTATAARFGVPGPNLEGYLYPATYTFPLTVPLDTVIAHMVSAYRRVWTEERRARADSMGMSEREVVTLASIVEKEARVRDEMPIISGVFHNRLRIGMPLQADPTVQYALGVHQARLLYAHIDEVADNPYNTYRHRGLPPGPIGSPSVRGIDATLAPADVDYLYFVARHDGSHVFTRTLAEHNRARVASRREFEARGATQQQRPPNQQPAQPPQAPPQPPDGSR